MADHPRLRRRRRHDLPDDTVLEESDQLAGSIAVLDHGKIVAQETMSGHIGVHPCPAGRSVTDYPLTLRHRDGALTEVLYNASLYRDAGGNVLGVFAAARDVTEQKRALEEIAHQAKELERMTEVEHLQRLTVGRGLKMIELNKEIEHLKALL